MYEQIIYALVGAILYGVSGFIKTTPLEKFDGQIFLRTLCVGAAIGAVQVYMNVDYDAAAQIALSSGLTAVVENVVKAVWRRLHPEAKTQ